MMPRQVAIGLSLMLSAALPAAAAPPAPPGRPLAAIDLSQPFGARPGWRFTASQDPASPDPLGDGSDTVPGVVHLCVSRDNGRTCDPDVQTSLAVGAGEDLYGQPHYLTDARIVHPAPGRALLLIGMASLHGGNADQRVATVALGYAAAADRFVVAYRKRTGRNNNQEIRYIAQGPLRGAIVAAEPTQDAPFGFWISVDRPAADGRYRQVLRYRSATRYGDGNPLAVIDSEMPALQQRLGLWRPGMPLPLPAGACPAPHLVGRALWCTKAGAAP